MIKVLFRFSKKKFNIIDKPEDVQRILFDHQQKCQIFHHVKGEVLFGYQKNIKWIARAMFVFVISNTLLSVGQINNPSNPYLLVFGSWNTLSFSLSSFLGFLGLGILQVISRRTIKRIRLIKNSDLVQLDFFNAFWVNQFNKKPGNITIPITQFQNKTPAWMNFHRSQLTSMGKIWINLQSNQYKGVNQYQSMLQNILIGKPIKNQFFK